MRRVDAVGQNSRSPAVLDNARVAGRCPSRRSRRLAPTSSGSSDERWCSMSSSGIGSAPSGPRERRPAAMFFSAAESAPWRRHMPRVDGLPLHERRSPDRLSRQPAASAPPAEAKQQPRPPTGLSSGSHTLWWRPAAACRRYPGGSVALAHVTVGEHVQGRSVEPLKHAPVC